MDKNTIRDVAIIGAGIAGLRAARTLRDVGLDVVILEKSRGVGGRAATRRLALPDGGDLSVDHGAQFFTARDQRFQEQVARWQEEGVCFPWADGFHTWSEGSLRGPDPQWKETRYASRDGMNRIGKVLAEGLPVLREFQVSSARFTGEEWVLESDLVHSEGTVRARALFVSAPIPQALRLVGGYLEADQQDLLSRITCHPCVAVMARYAGGTPDPAWKGIQVRDPESPLSWMAWDGSRRRSGSPGPVAVLHGSAEFSNGWLDAGKEDLRRAGEELLSGAARIAGEWMATPEEFLVHRWRYAHSSGPTIPGGFLPIPANQLCLIGDGLNGGRVEGAWLSGLFAAEAFLAHRPR
jgi:hypothetical protein